MQRGKEIYTKIYEDIPILCGKPTLITRHAILQALARGIAWPDHIYAALQTGKVHRFGKRGIKAVARTIICVGEDVGETIVIKTVERR